MNASAIGFLALSALSLGAAQAAEPRIETIRTPDGGIQPQAVVDREGSLHLIYYKGDPRAGDVFYMRSADGGKTFSPPIRVNSVPGSAVAMGTIRGAQLAVGRSGRLHVAWNGSHLTVPADKRDEHGHSPMLYARLRDDGQAFEPQRNLMSTTYGLDGGGSIAADAEGNVYVIWHGVKKGQPLREEDRSVWVRHSGDNGKSFAPERQANREATGACGCCGLRGGVDNDGRLLILYRTAKQFLNRDMRLLVSSDKGRSFKGLAVDAWRIGQCPMSSAFISPLRDRMLLAWETDQHVHLQQADPVNGTLEKVRFTADSRRNAKHPVAVANRHNQVLLLWTEGTGWNRGGAVAWQVYDEKGKPIEGAEGRTDGLPVWSFAAACALPDGAFVIIH